MQSSADSVLLSAAAATSHDLLGGAPARTSRLLVVAYGALGLAVALAMRDVLETFRLGYTIFASGLILPTLVAFAPAPPRAPRGGRGRDAPREEAPPWRRGSPDGDDPVLTGTAVNALVLLTGLRRRAGGEPALSRDR